MQRVPVLQGQFLQVVTAATLASFPLDLQWVIEMEDGSLTFFDEVVSASATEGNLARTTFPLPKGTLVAISARGTSGSSTIPQCHITVGLTNSVGDNDDWQIIIMSCNINSNVAKIWPGAPQEYLLDGPGEHQIVGISNPAAGADWSQAVTNSMQWKILTIEATFTADANAADRAPTLQIRSSSDDIMRVGITNVISENTARRCTWSASFGYELNRTPDKNQGAPDFMLFEGVVIEVVTTNIQVGDQWSDIDMFIRKWPMGTNPI